MGIEPTKRCFQRFTGFENRGDHQISKRFLLLSTLNSFGNNGKGLGWAARVNHFFKVGNIVARLSQPRPANSSARRAELL